MDPSMTAIDVFAGAGGATAGLKAAGFRVVAAVEIDPTACRTYRLNHPDVPLFEEDARRVAVADLLRAAGLRKGETSLLQACPPCQTWSSLGSASPEDPRNQLVSVVSDLIRRLRPHAFVIENVPGLRCDARLAALFAEAERQRYRVRAYIVDAQHVGVPQRRRRLIALGIRSRRRVPLPESLLDLLPPAFDRKARTVRDAIGHLPAPGAGDDQLHCGRTLTDIVMKRVGAIPAAGRRTDLPEHLQLACHRKLKGRVATASYGRMAANDVAPTLTTRCTTPACGCYIHPWEDRGITLREAALLQTFPAGYAFSGGYGAIERQIGNAIPVRLAEAAATAVRALLTSTSALRLGT
jgi:DNA (cytosine-5)-methyltransferase 1